MKILQLLRHAKAEPGSKDVSDLDRPLSARGREACAVIGAYLREKNLHPSVVIASPSTRTVETYERVQFESELAASFIREKRLYLASPEEILRCVRELPNEAESAMVIGHNPGMHHAALLFAESKPSRLRLVLELKYPTGALTVLRFDAARWQDVGAGGGVLVDFVAPGDFDA